MEEVAERKGEEIDGLKGTGSEQDLLWAHVYLCVWVVEHIATAFKKLVDILLCIILRDACVRNEGLQSCSNKYPLIIYKVLNVC